MGHKHHNHTDGSIDLGNPADVEVLEAIERQAERSLHPCQPHCHLEDRDCHWPLCQGDEEREK